MVHALREAHRLLKPNGILLDVRPAEKHRRAGVGEGKRWQFVGAMREDFSDDHAADRAVKQVLHTGLFRLESQSEFDLDRLMDTLQDFRLWLEEFAQLGNFPSHDWLYRRMERFLAKKREGTRITVRGQLKIASLRKLTSEGKTG